MDLFLSFAVFIASMIASLSLGCGMIYPLLIGLTAFMLVGLRRGYGFTGLCKMALKGAWGARFVVIILLLIGCLTSLWRQCGTIAYFTACGVRLIPKSVFLLAAFLLTGIMSYALGTSFGTAGTIGVILMTIARAGGVSIPMTCGAIMSGIYIGDRGSPAASSAALVANETGTDVSDNFRKMLPSTIVPVAICLVFYTLLSLLSRPESIDYSLLESFDSEFKMSAWCLVPAAVLLLLAFTGMKIRYVMMIDIVVSAVFAVILQKLPVWDVARMTLTGYATRSEELSSLLSGGGILSMVNISLILLISSAFSGIFEGTGMLNSIEKLFGRLSNKVGRFPAMCVSALCCCAVFCNQTISIIMSRQFMSKHYGDSDAEKDAFMLDIENSVITIAGLVPWCIACSVPIGLLGGSLSAIPFSAFLYLVPLCYALRSKRKKHW